MMRINWSDCDCYTCIQRHVIFINVATYTLTRKYALLCPLCLSHRFIYKDIRNVQARIWKIYLFSQLSLMQYMVAVRIHLTQFSYDDFWNTCTLSCYHHQNGSMTRLPLFRVRSWNNGMRRMSFYILIVLFIFVHKGRGVMANQSNCQTSLIYFSGQ